MNFSAILGHGLDTNVWNECLKYKVVCIKKEREAAVDKREGEEEEEEGIFAAGLFPRLWQ